ncbi:hypothetical protein VTN49DRAFT_7766 [Thermomyces lanuginosus]|uniref:uncharacterized protein n=1 Tax=Thermomyces lanuginosus TaxID=5541 RepID=UPI003741F835
MATKVPPMRAVPVWIFSHMPYHCNLVPNPSTQTRRVCSKSWANLCIHKAGGNLSDGRRYIAKTPSETKSAGGSRDRASHVKGGKLMHGRRWAPSGRGIMEEFQERNEWRPLGGADWPAE